MKKMIEKEAKAMIEANGLKKFIISGPKTKRVLYLKEDEMLVWDVVKILDYQNRKTVN